MQNLIEREEAITPDMSISQVIAEFPRSIDVFLRHGLGCVGCAVARFETIRQGAQAHGIDVDVLLKDLNEIVAQS